MKGITSSAFLLLTFLVLTFVSCTKREEEYSTKSITVSGYVTDVVTGDRLANTKVRLRADSRGGSSQLKDFEQVLDSTITDFYGQFQFTLRCAPDAPYGSDAFANHGIEHVKENYWKNPNMTLARFGCAANNHDNINVIITPLAWVKVHIKNEAPANVSDSIYYNGPIDKSLEHANEYSAYAHRIARTGAKIDTTFLVTIEADEAPLHYWDVTENGVTTRSAAYVGCNPLDTCELNVFF